MRNIFLSAAVFLGALSACIGHITARTETRATEEVCGLIRDNFYQANKADVREFLRRCETDNIPFTYTRARAIRNLNRRLGQIHSSHLSVYDPAGTKQLWENEGQETGLRSRMIDGELVVTGTAPESPARRAELKAGDVVVNINGQMPTSEEGARTTPGFYKIARDRKIFLVNLQLEDVQEDLSPSLVHLNNKETSVLRLPSFLPQYFDEATWSPLSVRLSSAKNLIVDLRSNPGGSFPAMLRVLSSFLCHRELVGTLWRAQGEPSDQEFSLEDNLDATSQLAQFLGRQEITLRTFGRQDDACFQGPVVVLVDSGTSSVSEIFTDAIMSRARTQVWGALTAGQVVMARWFPVASLGGSDYAISIPIAGFRNARGKEIEQEGVRPSKEMYDRLEDALQGEDSWINDARDSF